MIKTLVILFNTFSVFLFSFFAGDAPVSVTGNFPKTVSPGSEFVTEITINKNSITGFAKLQVEVPQGFTVKESDSKGGNFSFAGNIAKIIWTAIPSETQFTVKFLMTVDASGAGIKSVGSKFSYVSNNNKEVVEMTPAEIQVGENTGSTIAVVTPTTTTAVTTTEPVATPTVQAATPAFGNPIEPTSNVICMRTITKLSVPNEYNVDVKIKKPTIKGFAKFQEILPAGYTAKGDKTNGSSFSVSDGKAKFVWVSLPADDEMLVSYILIKETTDNAEVKLDGEFSYLENDQTKKIKLNNDVVSFDQTSASANNLVTTTDATNTTNNSTSQNAAVTTTSPNTGETTTNAVARRDGNVMYAVQVGAFRNAIQPEILVKKFAISETIKSEMADGYSKFLVGNFLAYKEARNHREEIKQQGCKSAFVAAYNGAKRITVQEALMITSQKWFK